MGLVAETVLQVNLGRVIECGCHNADAYLIVTCSGCDKDFCANPLRADNGHFAQGSAAIPYHIVVY
jgi:hypothetical protein